MSRKSKAKVAVEMRATVYHEGEHYTRGEVYEVDEETAKTWIKYHAAKPAETLGELAVKEG
jgi:hypothetical protein